MASVQSSHWPSRSAKLCFDGAGALLPALALALALALSAAADFVDSAGAANSDNNRTNLELFKPLIKLARGKLGAITIFNPESTKLMILTQGHRRAAWARADHQRVQWRGVAATVAETNTPAAA